MIKDFYKDIGDVALEDTYAYAHAKLGTPERTLLPEIYNILSDIDFPTHATYFLQYLQGGAMLGAGWRGEEVLYDHALLARTSGYLRCKNLSTPTKILLKVNSKSLQPICIFFQEEGKVYIAVPLRDNTILRQEVLNQLDENGGEMTLRRLEDFERNLGTKETFDRVGLKTYLDKVGK